LRGVFVLLFIFSVILNIYLLLLIAADLERGFDIVTLKEGRTDQTIALYTLEGIIDDVAAARVASFAREVQKDDKVKAVVLRVISPGGGVGPSDQIHALIGSLKDAGKKVVVSMGDMAASGGYYVSVAADEIVAEPTTLTGSIGVLAQWPVIKGTLEKIGAEVVTMKSTHARDWKDQISIFKKPDDRQRAYLQDVLDKIQERFEQIVRNGRGSRLKPRQVAYTMPVGEGDRTEKIEITETEPFNGKIYLPEEAKSLGLVDLIGYQSTAVQRAQELAHLDNPKVVRYKLRRGLLQELLAPETRVGFQLDAEMLDELQTPRVQMIWKVE
jgi:protease-4